MSLGWREQVLRALYEAEATNADEIDTGNFLAKARRTALGVWAERARLDGELDEVSDHWRVERMPAVDRNILRLGLYELHHHPDTPRAVVISEAVELAKAYSTRQSGAFVNGVLDRLADLVRVRGDGVPG